ncbi:MAG: hypothetical protein AABY40_03895 [Nanoarchaeota archaeon]
MTKDLNKIIEDNKKTFAIDTFKQILKGWGVNFSNLSLKEKTETLTGILQLADIHLAKDPAGGLAIKIMEQRRRDTDTQERIRFAQSFNLAVQLVSNLGVKKLDDSVKDNDVLKEVIEYWQEYFYQKLSENQEGE